MWLLNVAPRNGHRLFVSSLSLTACILQLPSLTRRCYVPRVFIVLGYRASPDRAAQAYMINRCLEWGGIEEGPNAPKTAVDIGEGLAMLS